MQISSLGGTLDRRRRRRRLCRPHTTGPLILRSLLTFRCIPHWFFFFAEVDDHLLSDDMFNVDRFGVPLRTVLVHYL